MVRARMRVWAAKRWLPAGAALASTAMMANPGLAQASCSGGPAVELVIRLEPPDPAVREGLRQRLQAELAARHVGVCPRVPGVPLLGRVQVRSAAPGLELASVIIETPAHGVLERKLEVGALPREARPSAIASATDELLATLLAIPLDPPGEAASRSPPPPDRAAALPVPAPARAARWALGLGAAAGLFRDAAVGYGADVRVRSWPAPRWPLTLAFGASTGARELPAPPRVDDLVSRPPASPLAAPTGARYWEWHVVLDGGHDLLPSAEPLGLTALAGVSLHVSTLTLQHGPAPAGRIGFRTELQDATIVDNDVVGSELVARLGLEGTGRLGAFGLSSSLIGLIPLASSHAVRLELSDGTYTQRHGLGAHWGVELGLGVWLLVD